MSDQKSLDREVGGDEVSAEFEARIMRMQADQENLLRRARRRQGEAVGAARNNVLSSLLPVLDSFDLALAAAPERNQFVNGIELVRAQLLEALQGVGLSVVGATGQFDPRIHEVVACVADSNAAEGEIVDVLRTGYEAAGVVLRPAQVRVAGPAVEVAE